MIQVAPPDVSIHEAAFADTPSRRTPTSRHRRAKALA